ncbi:MAG: hypothetical protein JSV56_09335 [Methanomassiliicoccales archaeon]|nr:MAG: hypothetical protein JSV56_09335 [Methanomassiliicoccales archaeon]
MQQQIAYEQGKWYKNELYFSTLAVALFGLIIISWMTIIEQAYIVGLIMSVLIIPIVVYLSYGAYQRYGWKLKKIEGLGFDFVVVKVKEAFDKNGIQYKETEPKKAFLTSQYCQSYSLENETIFFSILRIPPFVYLGLGKTTPENLELAEKIKKIMDLEFKNNRV